LIWPISCERFDCAHDARDSRGNGPVHIANTVDRLFRLENPVKHRGFHLNQHVIGRDRILAGCGQLAFEHGNLVSNLIEERHDKVDAGPKHRAQSPEPFHHVFFRLRHNANAEQDTKDNEAGEQQDDDILAKQSKDEVFWIIHAAHS
jgi:hypothetical protein